MKTILNTKLWMLLIVGICLFTSCEGDLDVNPQDDDATLAEEFYSNPEAYLQGLAGVYANLSLTGTSGAGSSNISGIDAGTSQYGRGLWNMQTLTTDEAIWSYENDPGLRDLNRNTWSADNPIFRGMYGRAMFQVALANEYLRQTSDGRLDARNVPADVRANIVTYRAEARFLRALAYYHLLDLFGKAAFITEDDPLGAFQAPQYERAQLFEFIESELLAINDDLLPAKSQEYPRADRGAAWMVLAKLYLNAEVYIGENRYADCLNYCSQIIQAGYTLAPNYEDNFKADNDSNAARNEIIFYVSSDGQVTQNFGPTTVMVNGSVGSIEQNGVELGVNAGGWGGAIRVPRQFAEKFDGPDFANDSRNNLITAGRPADISSIADRDQGYIITKFSNVTSTGTPGQDRTFVDADFTMFRLADVYLMYAEAHLRGGGGDASTAVGYINQLRQRANNGSTSANITAGELNLSFIIDERLRELHWEGHRRQDLIRFNLFTGNSYNWAWKGNSQNGASIPSFLNLYPMPTQSLAANPNLTQNPGY